MIIHIPGISSSSSLIESEHAESDCSGSNRYNIPKTLKICSGNELKLIPNLDSKNYFKPHHHVIDIVPKPHNRTFPIKSSVLDQTIGVPTVDESAFSGFNQITEVNEQRALLSKKPDESLSSLLSYQLKDDLFPWNSLNISETTRSITYHPLTFGPIPLLVPNKDIKKKLPVKIPSLRTQHSISRYINKFSEPVIASSTQPNSQISREHTEKSKVKFSRTVSVAVVQVSFISDSFCSLMINTGHYLHAIPTQRSSAYRAIP